jgi:hypothetical protein
MLQHYNPFCLNRCYCDVDYAAVGHEKVFSTLQVEFVRFFRGGFSLLSFGQVYVTSLLLQACESVYQILHVLASYMQ